MSFNRICDYSSDSDDESFAYNELLVESIVKTIINELVKKVEHQIYRTYSSYRNKIHYDSDSDSDLSPWSPADSEDNNDDSDLDVNKPCKTKGELTFDDLPKIQKLNITSPVEQLTQIGNVDSIVNQLVVVKSFTNIPVLDLDSMLFLKNGSELGQIFDVIGPVKQPNYVIRFNSNKEITESNIQINTPVYYNSNFPQPYTKYVFVNDLIKQRGSDASWKDNNEPPPEALDYSDDEVERIEKWKMNSKIRNRV